MNDSCLPEMSVVISTPDSYETIRRTISYLRAQTVRDQLEIVIVAPSADELGLDTSELEVFLNFCVVEVGKIKSISWAYAAGIRRATAPVVALAEDHSYPDPDWAKALIKAHQQPWAAVGPVLRNANPSNTISWADMLIAYAQWLDPATAGVTDHLPGHNSSYKRAILMDYGPQLETMLEAESLLHWDLRAKGYQLYLEPAAKTSHTNFALLSSWIPVQFYCGRLFGADRAKSEHWSPLRRLLYIGGSPLIPLVRLWRIIQELRRHDRQYNLLPRVLPALILGLALDGLGQMIGYTLGAGAAMQKLSDFEFHRDRHLARDKG